MVQILPTTMTQVGLLDGIERSAGQAFLAIADLAWIADDDVMSPAEHQRFIELGTSWTAWVENQCLGFVCGEQFGDALHVWELAVHADAQRRGVGAALMQHALAEAVRRKLTFVTLTTFRDVAFNAPFYQRLGFEIVAPQESARLVDVLAAEAAHGFPAESRCAMRFEVGRFRSDQ